VTDDGVDAVENVVTRRGGVNMMRRLWEPWMEEREVTRRGGEEEEDEDGHSRRR
jgi:hypothetical protein